MMSVRGHRGPPRSNQSGTRRAIGDGSESSTAPQLRVVIPTDWEALDELRDFVGAFLEGEVAGGVATRAIFAAQELLELAVRYGLVTGDIELEIYLAAPSSRGAREFELHISNEMLELRLEYLKRLVESVRATDATSEYQRLVKQVAAGHGDETALAFVRILFESAIDLDLLVDGRRVTMVARGA